jgi:integrase
VTALTNTAIDAMLPGAELKDDRVPGLSVRAHGSGKSFMLYYRNLAGRPRRPKIGDCGVLSLAEARNIARGILARVRAGDDPSAERVLSRTDPTVDELWDRVEREHYNRGKTWDKEAKRLYHLFIKPKLGRGLVAGVGYEDAKKVHDALADMPAQANRVIAVLGHMLKLAERWGYRPLGTNPVGHIRRFPENSRRRFASRDEIKTLAAILAIKATANDPDTLSGVAFLYLLMFSGARPSEIGNATPAMLERVERDGHAFGVLRIADGKTGRRDVFLPPQAVAVLDRLPQQRSRLAGRKTVPRKLWDAIRTEAGCPDLWARDWRRTFATVALSNGVPLSKVGELLGHADPRTTKIYAKLMEEDAHATAAEVAGQMAKLMAG